MHGAERKEKDNGGGKKHFDGQKSQDFRIRDDDGVTHRLRVKPNAIAVKEKNGRKYHQVSIEDFTAWARETGKQVTQ